MDIWGRVRDALVTARTRAAIAERECQHDGSEPWCRSCAAFYNPA